MSEQRKKPLNEPVLEDDYPVYAGFLYLADGQPVESDITGTVRHLKADLRVKEIRRCDAVGRGLF